MNYAWWMRFYRGTRSAPNGFGARLHWRSVGPLRSIPLAKAFGVRSCIALVARRRRSVMKLEYRIERFHKNRHPQRCEDQSQERGTRK